MSDPTRDRGEPEDAELDEEAKAALAEAEREGAAGEAKTDEAPPLEDESAEPGLDEVDVRELLRSALAPPPGAVAPELLRGVQKRIRQRSRGKFYGDGWSTARSPRSTYLVTSLVMLGLILFVLFVLIPWGGGALP